MLDKYEPVINPAEAMVSDPIDALEFLYEMPSYSAAGNSRITEQFLVRSVDRTRDVIADPNPTTALSTLGLLDYQIGTLIRFRIDPVTVAPELAPTLIRLGDIASSMPRGTLATYVGSNNPNKRVTFSGTEEEDVFIESLWGSYNLQEEVLKKFGNLDIKDTNAVLNLLDGTKLSVEAMTAGLLMANKVFDPRFFSSVIRPFHDPLKLNGDLIAAPNGGQLPILAIEHILWENSEYDSDYYVEASKYLTVDQRNMVSRYYQRNGRHSIDSLAHENTDESQLLKSALLEITKTTRRFRYLHKEIARRNMEIRRSTLPEGVEPHGSGGFTLEDLEAFIQDTKDRFDKLAT